MNIVIAGDLVPTDSNINLFMEANVKALMGEKLHFIWKSAEIRILNLETPIVNKKTPIEKCGVNLISPKNSINGIKALDPSLLALANNHILDQGESGLDYTREVLRENDIHFIGAGRNLHEANQPYIFKKHGLNIGVYNCAENEFSIATECTAGANPFDPLESFDHIEKLKEKCDYILVLYHGGKEHYPYPSPYLQKVCRKIVEKGADLVVCQHSHCVGCYEEYRNSTILYGQGNFIFDFSDNPFWKTGLLIKLKIDDSLSIEYIPFVKKEGSIRLAENKEKEMILSKFHERSNEILKKGFIEKKYQEFAQENVAKYLRTFSGMGKWLSRIDRYILRGYLLKNKYSKKNLLALQNYIECEAHRELFLVGLKGECSGRK